MKTATFLSALCLVGLIAAPAVAQDVKLKMGGAGSQELQIAPGVPFNQSEVTPGIQIIEIKPTKTFDEAKTELEAGIQAYVDSLKTTEAQTVADELTAKFTAFSGLEAEFKALPTKDAATIATWTDKVFDSFMELKTAYDAMVAFEAENSKQAYLAIEAITPMVMGDQALQGTVQGILEPFRTATKSRVGVMNDAVDVLQSTYQDSTVTYMALVIGGEPRSEATSQMALKTYFAEMLQGWSH